MKSPLSRSSSISERARQLTRSSGPQPLELESFGATLPEGWNSAVDDEGNIYFYSEAGAVQWNMPGIED